MRFEAVSINGYRITEKQCNIERLLYDGPNEIGALVAEYNASGAVLDRLVLCA